MFSRSALFLALLILILQPACTTTPKPAPEPAPELTQQPPAPRQPTLYEDIEADIAALRLTSPPNNNAIVKIEKLRQQNANDPAIPRYENLILRQYLSLIDRTLARTPAASKDDLHRALRFVTNARLVAPDSAQLADRENTIIDRLEVITQQERAAREKPSVISEPVPAPQPEPESAEPVTPVAEQAGYLTFKQADIDNRSQEIGLLLDKISPAIVQQRLPVIIHARNMRDFRWISASLRTSIYFIDANFDLQAEPHISEAAIPGIEVMRK
jgi:hypothetical protein